MNDKDLYFEELLKEKKYIISESQLKMLHCTSSCNLNQMANCKDFQRGRSYKLIKHEISMSYTLSQFIKKNIEPKNMGEQILKLQWELDKLKKSQDNKRDGD